MFGALRMRSSKISLFDDLPAVLFARIEREFHRSHRPLLLGEVSLVVGWSLERTEQALSVLVERGTVRHATIAEKVARDLVEDASLYALAGERSLQIAGW